MAQLFGIDLAGIIAAKLGPRLLPGVLTRSTNTVRTVGQLTGGLNLTTATYSFRGMQELKKFRRTDTLEWTEGTVVTILGGTCSVSPQPGDVVSVNGGTALTVSEVRADPARAAYECLVDG